jgi:FlaG/FlaF family flagellin (archaellin)
MVADVAVTPVEATVLMVGIVVGFEKVAPAFTVRSSSAEAAQCADDEAEVQLTEDGVAAVLSHNSVSA